MLLLTADLAMLRSVSRSCIISKTCTSRKGKKGWRLAGNDEKQHGHRQHCSCVVHVSERES